MFLICNRKTDAHGNKNVAVNDVFCNDCVYYELKRCYCISDSFCAHCMGLNNNSFQALLQKNCEKRLLALSCLLVRLSVCVRMEPLVSRWTVFMKFGI
jgi:hypothetical protein